MIKVSKGFIIWSQKYYPEQSSCCVGLSEKHFFSSTNFLENHIVNDKPECGGTPRYRQPGNIWTFYHLLWSKSSYNRFCNVLHIYKRNYPLVWGFVKSDFFFPPPRFDRTQWMQTLTNVKPAYYFWPSSHSKRQPMLLTVRSSRYMVFERKSIPMVACCTQGKRLISSFINSKWQKIYRGRSHKSDLICFTLIVFFRI